MLTTIGDRDVGAGERPGDEAVAGPDALLAVEQQQRGVGVAELALDARLHALRQRVARALHAGQVDARGASRSLRFEVTVNDGNGKRMPDPDPSRFALGGVLQSPTIAPRAQWCQSLPLMRYARIDAPGTYRVHVVHDLGWGKGSAPAGDTTIVLAQPTAVEAEQVVATMEKLPANPRMSPGGRSTQWPDFSALRYPVYLETLLPRARSGSLFAVRGIGSIPSVAATGALVALLQSASDSVARVARQSLAMRLPDPGLNGALPPRGMFVNPLDEERKYLIAASWTESLCPNVRSAARTLLALSDESAVRSGAFFLEAVGIANDAPLHDRCTHTRDRKDPHDAARDLCFPNAARRVSGTSSRC